MNRIANAVILKVIITLEWLQIEIYERLPNKNKKLICLVNSLIRRDFPELSKGKGLPQGPLTSGFLANLYLDDFDRYMVKLTHNGYRRYVDDMMIFAKEEQYLKNIKNQADNFLKKKLGLELKEDKTQCGKIEELESVASDKDMDSFDKHLKKVLRSLYCLDRKTYDKYVEDPGKFLELYSHCLKELNIIINVNWLHRKLYYEHNRLKSIYHRVIGRYFSIKFPIPAEDNSDIERWKQDFISKNPKIMNEIEKLRKQLEYFCFLIL